MPRPALSEAFQVFDLDGDHFISYHDLLSVMAEMTDTPTNKEINQMSDDQMSDEELAAIKKEAKKEFIKLQRDVHIFDQHCVESLINVLIRD